MWQQASSKLSGTKLFLNCTHAPVLHNPQPVLFFASSPPLHLKLGLTNQLVNFLYTIDPSYEEMLEQLFGVVRKSPNKVYDDWHCTKILRSVERIKTMLPSSCGMILQTFDAFNNVCSSIGRSEGNWRKRYKPSLEWC